MKIKTSIIIIILIILGISLISLTFFYARKPYENIPLEKNVKILDIEIDRRNNIIMSITIYNEGDPLILEGASLVKIQAWITIISTKFSQPIIAYTNTSTKIPLGAGYKLDPEGADYYLYIFTNKGTAIRCMISYPTPVK
jgi:hypothetical protein